MACPVAPDEHWIIPPRAFNSLRQNPISKTLRQSLCSLANFTHRAGLVVILKGPFRKTSH